MRIGTTPNILTGTDIFPNQLCPKCPKLRSRVPLNIRPALELCYPVGWGRSSQLGLFYHRLELLRLRCISRDISWAHVLTAGVAT
mgnify:CR=1 FL=1